MLHKRGILFLIQGGNILGDSSVSALEKRRKGLLGKEFSTNNNGDCFIFDYTNSEHVLIMFKEHPCVVKCTMHNLTKGKVKNPFKPVFNGRGYMGVGKYSFSNRKHYQLWTNMLIRAYDENFLKRYPTYKDVEVCNEWLNFQNFAAWCDMQEFFNTKDDKGRSYHLDKDILVRGNKVYSPETCCFVPNNINSLINLGKSRRGAYPIGVAYHKALKLYTSSVGAGFKDSYKHLGYFNCPEKAFSAYKTAKELIIKEVAEYWKMKISDKTYKALMAWEIGVDD